MAQRCPENCGSEGVNLLNSVFAWIECTAGSAAPLAFLLLFIAGSFLMIWRLEAMKATGVEGTVLGTLVMPYCSGIGNLIFASMLGLKGGRGEEVLTNSLVNNVTNLTLLIGLPAVFWSMSLRPEVRARKKRKGNDKEQQTQRINRLSLLLTLTAVLFFTGAVWALARDGKLDFGDGLVLVGLFLFWQCFHVFDVLKGNVRQCKSLSWKLPVDLALLAAGAFGIYLSTDWLVNWVSGIQTGFFSAKHLGWLSGWLMVLPNGLLAVYYAWRGNPEVVYTSQVGDGHISIPLCLGVFALFRPIQVPHFFETGILILLGAALVHFFFVAVFGRLPRFIGLVLIAAYGVFLYEGLGK